MFSGLVWLSVCMSVRSSACLAVSVFLSQRLTGACSRGYCDIAALLHRGLWLASRSFPGLRPPLFHSPRNCPLVGPSRDIQLPRRSHYRITVFLFLFFRCFQTFLFPSAADDGLDSRLSPSANSTWRRLNNRPSSLDPAKSFPAQVRPLEAPNHPDGKPNPNHSFARLPGRSRSFIHSLAQLNQSVSPLTADNRFFPRIRQGFPSI